MKILLVEDDVQLAAAVSTGLSEEGHAVDRCGRADAARAQTKDVEYDVVILDWSLPDEDGVSLLRDLRAHGLRTPVLMLTARGSVGERITGLRAGADDYLVKPFDFGELLARLDALARRSAGQLDVLTTASATVDGPRRALRGPAGEVPLTAREYALAVELFRKRGEVLSRSHLLRAVWGDGFLGDPNIVDVYVGYLRQKLARAGAADVAVRAVRGVGYRLVHGDDAKESG